MNHLSHDQCTCDFSLFSGAVRRLHVQGGTHFLLQNQNATPYRGKLFAETYILGKHIPITVNIMLQGIQTTCRKNQEQ